MTAELAEARAVAGDGSPKGRRPGDADVPLLLWMRTFAGTPENGRLSRRWIEGLLPGCGPRDDLAVIVGELVANAVTHTRSGDPGGELTVHLAWSPGTARVTVGDQGSAETPGVIVGALEAEGGRGLCLVDALAGGWGFAGGAPGRQVWADVPWLWAGGPPRIDPDGALLAAEAVRSLCHSYPGIQVGYDGEDGEPPMWWSLLPGGDPCARLMAPCFGALCEVTAAAWAAPRPGRSGAPQPGGSPVG